MGALDRQAGPADAARRSSLEELAPLGRLPDAPHVGPIEHFDDHLPAGHRRELTDLRWTTASAPLFAGRPSGRDVQQGEIGDCFLAAPWAAAAHRRPDAVAERVTADGTGRCEVRLDDGNGDVRTHRLEPSFPEATDTRGGDERLVELHGDAERATWFPLAEKASAAERPGGYAELHEGGRWRDSQRELQWATGERAEIRSLSRPDAEVLADLGAPDPVCFGTRSARDELDRQRFDEAGLTPEHEYWVDRVDGDSVVLGDPRGLPDRTVRLGDLRRLAFDDRYLKGGLQW